jgi:hypothetical protein
LLNDGDFITFPEQWKTPLMFPLWLVQNFAGNSLITTAIGIKKIFLGIFTIKIGDNWFGENRQWW